MGLFTDSVPRDLYDALQKRYDDLLEKYHSLRPTHAPVKPITMALPKPDSGELALQAAHLAVSSPQVRKVAESFMREQGMSEADALREAARLDGIARGRALPPNAAPPEPPAR